MSESGGTTDLNRVKQSAEFQELVERLWERWRGRKVTRDRSGRVNRQSFANFLANVILAAYRANIPDPYKTIDWEAAIDPDLPPSENLGLLERQYGIRVEERPPLPGMTDEDALRREIESTEDFIRDLDYEIRYGEDREGHKLTPEQIEDARRRKAELEERLRRLETELEEIEKRKPLPTPERGRGAPRRRARPAEERAPAPAPAPEEEEVERARLWELFALALTAAGLDPSQYEDEFESIYNTVRGRPYLEKFRAVMRHASALIKENRPEVYVPTEAITRQVEEAVRRELESQLESLAERLTRPVTPEEYSAAAEAELASVPPEESIVMAPVSTVKQTPQECGGHAYVWVPDSDALGVMRRYGVSNLIIRKFYTCPERWYGEADGFADLEFTVAVMDEVGEVPHFFAEWLMELAKAIDDRYEEEGRLKGIGRYRDLKRDLGRFTAVGK